MTMGEMKFKQKGREEQCEPDTKDNFRKACLKNDAKQEQEKEDRDKDKADVLLGGRAD